MKIDKELVLAQLADMRETIMFSVSQLPFELYPRYSDSCQVAINVVGECEKIINSEVENLSKILTS